MFLFIGIMLKTLKEKYGFKYISCSYLSGSECEMAITEDNLNTSHVLIYLSIGIAVFTTLSI